MPSQVLSDKDSRLARSTLSWFKSVVSRPTMWPSFSRAMTMSPARNGPSICLTASSKPRVARVVEAKAALALKDSHNGSRLNRATSASAAVAESVTKKSDSVMPARKSRRAWPLRNQRSPCEIKFTHQDHRMRQPARIADGEIQKEGARSRALPRSSREIASPSISLIPGGAAVPGYGERLIALRWHKNRRGEIDVYPPWDLPAGAALSRLDASANPFLTAE